MNIITPIATILPRFASATPNHTIQHYHSLILLSNQMDLLYPHLSHYLIKNTTNYALILVAILVVLFFPVMIDSSNSQN